MYTKQLCVAAAVLFLIVFIGSGCDSSVFSSGKVGYINLERLVKESEMGKTATAEIETLRQEKQATISQLTKEIREIKIDKANEKDPKIAERNALIENYKNMVAQAREEIAKQDRQLVAEILKKADGALKTIAKEKKFTIILKDPNAIGYLDESVDITSQVLAELNK